MFHGFSFKNAAKRKLSNCQRSSYFCYWPLISVIQNNANISQNKIVFEKEDDKGKLCYLINEVESTIWQVIANCISNFLLVSNVILIQANENPDHLWKMTPKNKLLSYNLPRTSILKGIYTVASISNINE